MGRTDPEAEFTETVRLLIAQAATSPKSDASILCRFPARALWLARELGRDFGNPYQECEGFKTWVGDSPIEEVSAIYASGYLSNPGSVYGHLMLRFHGSNPTDPQDLLETAINYGAQSSEEDPALLYVVRGLFGGYQSTYSSLEFFHHNNRFRDDQLRDIWEYRLNLSDWEVSFLQAHIWELMNAHNTYYFLRQNCAYYVADLLNLVLEPDLIDDMKPWVVPVDIFQRLASGQENQDPLVKSFVRLSSREARFREGYARLSPLEKSIADEVLKSRDGLALLNDASLSDGQRINILNVSLDYAAYALDDTEPDSKAHKNSMLLARISLPASGETKTENPPAPHEGQPATTLQLRAFDNTKLGAGVELRIRPAYYDFLSNTAATPPFSELSMVDTKVVITDDDVFLRQMEVLKISALNVSATTLPEDKKHAWQIRLGAEQRDLSCSNCLVAYAEGGIGKAAMMGDQTAIYGFATGRVTTLDTNGSSFKAGLSGGIITAGDNWAASLSGKSLQQIDGPQHLENSFTAELRLGQGTDWDVRLKSEYNKAHENSVALSYYW
ncbi:MAG: DUF4105 domain-containing protein [Aquisalinus sp.]|nr:DUF4105 domain-containing protein [Aquisalinus sp.]